MEKSSRAATNFAMKRAKERATTKKPKGFWNAVGNGTHRFADYMRSFERSLLIQAIIIGVGIASFVVLIKTYNAFQEDREFRQEERKNWRLDRIDRAWNRVLRRATGNTAKGKALSYLFSQNVTLKGIDLSCKTMGGMENGKCLRPITITDLEISSLRPLKKPGIYFDFSYIRDPTTIINFNGAIIDGFRMNNESATINLDGALVRSAKITNSMLYIENQTNTVFSESEFDRSLIVVNGNVAINGSNISGTRFLEQEDSKFTANFFNWFWADGPPLCIRADIKRRVRKPLPCPFIFVNNTFNRTNVICAALTQRQVDRLTKKGFEKPKGLFASFFRIQGVGRCSTGTKNHLGFGTKRHIRTLTIKAAAFLYPQIYYGRRYPHP